MDRLKGKVAIVTGGASGIGAASSRAMVNEGALVVVADEAGWRQVVAFAEATFGQLNVLVNGAGIGLTHPLANHPRDIWERTLAVNLTGPFLGLVAALEALTRGVPSSVVNISSYAGLNGVSPQHALTGLTRSAARELAPLGVRVNSVHPGGVATPMIGAFSGQVPTTGLNTLQRVARPEEIAAMIVFLASDESSYSTGSQFSADGGLGAGMTLPG